MIAFIIPFISVENFTASFYSVLFTPIFVFSKRTIWKTGDGITNVDKNEFTFRVYDSDDWSAKVFVKQTITWKP